MKHRELGAKFHYDRSYFSEPVPLSCLHLIQIGELCLEAGFDVAPHRQSCCEISCILSGSGSFLWEGQRLSVTAGDLVVTPPYGTHAIAADEGQSLFYAYAGFRFLPGDVPFGTAVCDTFRQEQRRIRQNRQDFYPCFRTCMEESGHAQPGGRLLLEAGLTQMLVWTYRAMCGCEPARYDEAGMQESGRLVYLALKYVDQNIFRPLTVQGISAALGYSAHYLSHLFREREQDTLQHYISRRKTEKAMELMARNRLTVTEIADRLAYPNVQSFSRSFRRETGLSPTAYLAAQRNRPAD